MAAHLYCILFSLFSTCRFFFAFPAFAAASPASPVPNEGSVSPKGAIAAQILDDALGAASNVLKSAFKDGVNKLRRSRMARELKYIVEPPNTNPEKFEETINGIGHGFAAYLGCMDMLDDAKREELVQEVAANPTCASALRSFSRFDRFSNEQIGFQRLEVMQRNLKTITEAPEVPEENVEQQEQMYSATHAALKTYEADLDKLCSALTQHLLSPNEHEKVKLFLRKMGPQLLQSLLVAWAATKRMAGIKKHMHRTRLAAAARDLSRVDTCLWEEAKAVQVPAMAAPNVSYFSTPAITAAEINPRLASVQLLHQQPLQQQLQQQQQLPGDSPFQQAHNHPPNLRPPKKTVLPEPYQALQNPLQQLQQQPDSLPLLQQLQQQQLQQLQQQLQQQQQQQQDPMQQLEQEMQRLMQPVLSSSNPPKTNNQQHYGLQEQLLQQQQQVYPQLPQQQHLPPQQQQVYPQLSQQQHLPPQLPFQQQLYQQQQLPPQQQLYQQQQLPPQLQQYHQQLPKQPVNQQQQQKPELLLKNLANPLALQQPQQQP